MITLGAENRLYSETGITFVVKAGSITALAQQSKFHSFPDSG